MFHQHFPEIGQMAEQSPPTLEDPGSNPDISNSKKHSLQLTAEKVGNGVKVFKHLCDSR